MPSLASIFSRVSGGAPSVSASEAQKKLLKAGGFGMLSLTGSMLKKGIEKGLQQADKNGDGKVDADEFSAAVRGAIAGKTLPTWDSYAAGKTSLSHADVANLVSEIVKQKAGAMGGMVDASGIAKMVIAFADDDGDGKLSRAEFDSLKADLG